MKKLLTLLSFFSISIMAQDFDPKLLTVKTISGKCNGTTNEQMEGSGFLFIHQNQIYAVTSEHVLFHETRAGICHYVTNPLIGKLPAELANVTWEKGVALLKIRNFNGNRNLPSLSHFKDPANITVKAAVAGYPHSSQALITDKNINFLSLNSDRHLFPSLNQLIEAGGKGDFGMSGGPLLGMNPNNLTTFSIYGLLSHQLVEMNPGRPARIIQRVGTNQNTVSNLLFISGSELYKWLKDYFSSTLDARTFYRSSNDQRHFTQVINVGGIRFQLVSEEVMPGVRDAVNVPSSSSIINQNPNIVSIIRGNDGIGTGGNGSEVISNDGKHFIINATLINSDESIPQKLPLKMGEFLAKVKQELLKNSKVKVVFLTEGFHRFGITSLEMFFTGIVRNYRPATVITPVNYAPIPSVEKLKTYGQSIENYLTQIQNNLQAADEEIWPAEKMDIVNFLDQLETIAKLFISENWGIIELHEYEQIMNSSVWEKMFNTESLMNNAIELKSLFLKSQQELRKIRI